jgi:hypothetical protein
MGYAINSTVQEGSHFGVEDAFERKEVLECGETSKNWLQKRYRVVDNW